MWNYSFMLPSFWVMLIILAYYFSKPRLSVQLNRTFLGIIVIELLTITFDFISTKADEMHWLFPIPVLYALNLVFFVLFIARSYWFFGFTADLVHIDAGKSREKRLLTASVFIISEIIALSSVFTGAVFRIDSGGYHSGPLYNVIYVCFCFYLTLSFLWIGINAKKLSRYDLTGVLGYNIILTIGIIVRMLMPKFLVMNTFCLLAIMVIFLSFVNPDLYISNRGGAFNTKAFRDRLAELDGKSYKMAAFNIKNYNDARGIYGGTQMDSGVAEISRYLQRSYPNYDVFYLRSGGFAILTDPDADIDAICGDIYARFAEPWEADDAELYLDVSFVKLESGMADYTPERIISNLFIAYEMHENVSGASIDMREMREIERQTHIKQVLEAALENDGIEIYLQPIISAEDGSVVGAEALARLRDKDGELIPPVEFIPIAEKNGRINLLGERVLEKSCSFIADTDTENLGLSWINVNLSPIQCMRKDLNERFSAIIEEYGIDAGKIHLEITEESMIDYSQLRKQLKALKGSGFEFVLDDYGSGYSNLTRVKHCPFVNIKLDTTVVWDYIKEHDEMLPTMVSTFKHMNFTVTAEGIETKEMAEALMAIGCDYLQGFYFARPMPPQEFVAKYSRV